MDTNPRLPVARISSRASCQRGSWQHLLILPPLSVSCHGNEIVDPALLELL